MTIRASALNLALHCPGQHALAAKHPTETVDTARGSAMHEEAAGALRERSVPAWLSWVVERHPELQVALQRAGGRWVEHPRRTILREAVLTGTPDLVVFTPSREGNSAFIFDWKSGYGRYLPPIERDWQMVAYAVLIHRTTACHPLTVYRVRVDGEREDALGPLSSDDLELAGEALAEVVLDVAARADERVVGSHCEGCLARGHCPEYLQRAEAMTTTLAPARGLQLQSAEQALGLLQALDPVRQAVQVAEQELRRWVDERGPICDAEGREWARADRRVERVVDSASAVAALTLHVGGYAALAVRTSKSAIVSAMKAAGEDKAAVEGLLHALRVQGALEERDEARYEWRRVVAR